ncbi:MAG: 2-oxoglutarate ferredoxin oxidoreductase subunit delta [Clostridia bacterium]|jgi:2-oxoglutarate ferredoxin oxidoreductase subunit delta|nr:2-oxoglutarate-acceptor oxidoreductase subunit OorD [Clostridiales bacterium]MDK2984573.1 2-oxoglutarate ferredoxin oxidoreductase subunit delta [Clostridia bacterium]
MGKVVVQQELCKGCGLCVEACPKNLLVIGKDANSKGYYAVVQKDEEEKCNGCSLCAIMCPDVALEVYR